MVGGCGSLSGRRAGIPDYRFRRIGFRRWCSGRVVSGCRQMALTVWSVDQVVVAEGERSVEWFRSGWHVPVSGQDVDPFWPSPPGGTWTDRIPTSPPGGTWRVFFFFKVALLPVDLGVSWSSANPSDLITSVVTTPLSTFNLRITEPDGWTRPTGSAADGRSVYGHISIKPPPVDGRRRDVQVCLWTRYDPSWRSAVNRFKRRWRQRRLAADLRSKRICGRTRRRIELHSKESWSSVSRAIDWCVTTFNSNWIKLTS